MKRSRQKKSLTLSNSRWLAYAAAGAASSLGAAQSAEAEIHYSGLINANVGGGVHYLHLGIPLGRNARLNFDEFTYQLVFGIEGAAVSNSFCGYSTLRFGSVYVSRLHQGAAISKCDFFPHAATMLILAPYSGRAFFSKGIGYIGFRFNNGDGMQYGWIRVKMPGPDYFEARFQLVDYAWGDPGDRIKAGQTSAAGEQVEAVPDQGSLGLLALGGAGLMAWRQRRRTTAH
jgi:hypothetical protein